MKKVDFYKNIIKMGETTYYLRKREAVLNRAKDYHESNKEE